ncbi:TlpA family protein disulfide reductase [Taibaiella koreensis]|uniref:TlpA family protein disulfide reductase n=1 Tax=Taibaiella koreensis TaxID=1268548 RepID=UPI000E5A009D|nr:hypothetical protein [Taibaiella koreensis]
MKKIFFAAAVLMTTGFFARGQEANAQYRSKGAALPALKVIDTTGKIYTGEAFKGNNHFFVFLFNPTCGHCIEMAKLMGKNITTFKKNDVLFMAGAAMGPYMGSFYQASGIGSHPEIKVGVDSAGAVDKLYSYSTLPQINIYDKDRKLVKTFNGDTPLDSLKKYVP